jgi:Fic family protein
MLMAELDLLLTDIDRLQEALQRLRPLTTVQLQRALDIEYTFESNRIEGNTLTLRETDLVVHQGLTIGGKSLREHLEALNHYEAIRYIRELAAATTRIGEQELRHIHALVLRAIDHDNAGRYRSVPVRISGSRHEPPQPWLVPELMQRYGQWLMSDDVQQLHPVIFAAQAHERLVTIHPFIDGNGRTARLVMNLLLLRAGYPIANIPGDTASRLAYYDALESANLSGDDTRFVTLIAGHVLQSSRAWLRILGGA